MLRGVGGNLETTLKGLKFPGWVRLKLVISSKTAGASSPLLVLEIGAKGHLASEEMSTKGLYKEENGSDSCWRLLPARERGILLSV